MWSMWNAPSDRDYYDPLGLDDVDESEICEDCGARWNRAFEEWCSRGGSLIYGTSAID